MFFSFPKYLKGITIGENYTVNKYREECSTLGVLKTNRCANEHVKKKKWPMNRMGMHRKKAKDTSLSKNYLIMIFW